MATYAKLEGPALEALRNLNSTLERRFVEQMGAGTPLITRMLCPEDIKMDSETAAAKYKFWFTLSSTGTTANTLINARQIDNNKFIGIYGVTVPTENTASQLEITRKGSVARKWNIQAAARTSDNTLYFDDPFTCDENTTLTIACYASSQAAASENLIFHGLTTEKVGLNVNPSHI